MRQDDGIKRWRWMISVVLSIPLLFIACLRVSAGEQVHAIRAVLAASEAAVIANYIGDMSFALTGSLAAGREGLDTFGCVVVGFVTALGGGTFRDVMLGRLPIWWMVAWDESLLCVVVASLAFFFWPAASRRWKLTLEDEWLFWTDTIGLATFAATGARTGHSITTAEGAKMHFGACAACGMFSATFGGLTRDVLIGRPSRILYSALELYALPAFAGGAATTAVLRTGLLQDHLQNRYEVEAILVGILVTVYIRVMAINRSLRLPSFPNDAVYSSAARPRDYAATVAKKEELQWKENHFNDLTPHEPFLRSVSV